MAKVSEEMGKVIKDFVNVIPSVSAHTEREDNPHCVTAEQLGLSKFENVTADAGELNILDGAKISTGELNFLKGTKSSVQAQFDSKADANHNHDNEYAPIFVSTKKAAPTESTAPGLDLPNVFRYYTSDGTEYLYKGKDKTGSTVKYLWEKTVLQDVNVSSTDINSLEGIEGNVQTLLNGKQDKIAENNYELVDYIHVGYTKVPSGEVFQSGEKYYYKKVYSTHSVMLSLQEYDGLGMGFDYCVGESMSLLSGGMLYSNSPNCAFNTTNPSQTIAYFGKPGIYRLFYENSGWVYNGSSVSLDDVAIYIYGTPTEGIYVELEIVSIDDCYTFSDTGISSLTRSICENGEPYNFKELYILVKGNITSQCRLALYFYDTKGNPIGNVSKNISEYSSFKSICYNFYEYKGFYFLNFTPPLSSVFSFTEESGLYTSPKNLLQYPADNPIGKFKLDGNLAAGATIYIFGVRK